MIKRISYKAIFISAVHVVALGLTGCNSDDSTSTIIKGTIQFPPADKIYFYSLADSTDIFLENKTAMDSSAIDKNGNYSFSLPLKNACAFDLVCGKKNLANNLFISPGDKLKIIFSSRSNDAHVISSGDAGKYNSYLIHFLDTFYRAASIREEYYIGTNYMDIQQFTLYNERRKQMQLDFFDNYFKGDSPKKELQDYALNTIHYGIAVDRLMYIGKKRMKGENVIADSSYFAFATPSFVENKDAFNCPAYIRFLNLYIKDMYERMVEREALPRDKSVRLIPAVEKYKLAMQLLHKPFRDAVLYNIIYNDMHDVTENAIVNPQVKLSPDSMMVLFIRKYSLN
ncbi:MAG TPA: hypothetical protein VI757_04420 [Bacteroidia bacterium]|nr:hypothetical protein [Bacteroidia bacterium]